MRQENGPLNRTGHYYCDAPAVDHLQDDVRLSSDSQETANSVILEGDVSVIHSKVNEILPEIIGSDVTTDFREANRFSLFTQAADRTPRGASCEPG